MSSKKILNTLHAYPIQQKEDFFFNFSVAIAYIGSHYLPILKRCQGYQFFVKNFFHIAIAVIELVANNCGRGSVHHREVCEVEFMKRCMIIGELFTGYFD